MMNILWAVGIVVLMIYVVIYVVCSMSSVCSREEENSLRELYTSYGVDEYNQEDGTII